MEQFPQMPMFRNKEILRYTILSLILFYRCPLSSDKCHKNMFKRPKAHWSGVLIHELGQSKDLNGFVLCLFALVFNIEPKRATPATKKDFVNMFAKSSNYTSC